MGLMLPASPMRSDFLIGNFLSVTMILSCWRLDGLNEFESTGDHDASVVIASTLGFSLHVQLDDFLGRC